MKAPSKYTITAQRLRNLDHFKCELHALADRLEDVVKKDVIELLHNTCAAIEKTIEPMTAAEEKREQELRKLTAPLEKDGSAVWSCGEEPFKAIFKRAPVLVVFVSNTAFIQPGNSEYESDPIVNPTYADAFKAFQESIEVTGDDHHVFFEGVIELGTKKGVKRVALLAGS